MTLGENQMTTNSIQSELQEFVRFASSGVGQGEDFSSVEELVRRWRQNSEYAEAVDDVRQGIEDEASGKPKPLSEVFVEVRRKLGITD